MASLTFSETGSASVYVTLAGGERRHIGLGNIGRQRAETIRGHISELEAANLRSIAPAPSAREWLSREVKPKLRDRLVECGLCEAGGMRAVPLGTFIDGYLDQRKAGAKARTVAVLAQARRHLLTHFKAEQTLDSVESADADAFRAYLIGQGLAKATVSLNCRYARHFFAVAVRRKLIADNPFEHIKCAVKGDPKRRVFIPAGDVLKVIDAATDAQWQLLIGMARFGGLRIPSEALALRWADVDMDAKRFTVRASKTEHHDDGGVRVVPMFPELVPLFEAVLSSDGAEGHVHVISRYRDATTNLRTQLTRYVTAAGLTPWPKPWQNMRASRATDLADLFPSHVCAAWLGHTEATADQCYRQVKAEHFAKAVESQTVRAAVRATTASDRTGYRNPQGNRVEARASASENGKYTRQESNL